MSASRARSGKDVPGGTSGRTCRAPTVSFVSRLPSRSNCLGSQAESGGCQGVISRTMALRIVSNLRMQATNATFFFLPAARRR